VALAVRGRHLPSCQATFEDLTGRVAASEADVNAGPCAVADRLWVKDHLDPGLDPGEDKPRFSNQTRFTSGHPQVRLRELRDCLSIPARQAGNRKHL
jgi:hypothetical protein